jgi:hypothetical protein
MVASLIILAGLVVFDVLSVRYGVDSRDGTDRRSMLHIGTTR